MRLFVAVVPPAEALAELDAELGPTRVAAPHGLRWTRPQQWHLTLAFLGEVVDSEVTALSEHFEAACAGPSLTVRFAGGGCFGDRVLWAGIAGDTHRLRALAAAVGQAAGADAGPYRPHLTLARAGREPADLRPAAAALAGVVGAPWTADAVHLMQSRLRAGPGNSALHSTVARYPLGAQ